MNILLVLIKLHKEVFLTCVILFVNKISLFLKMSQKIYFMVVNHPENSTIPEIFKAFKYIYQYYLHRGFRITTVHADGECGHLKILIDSLLEVPLVNMAAENEHVPDINRRIGVVK